MNKFTKYVPSAGSAHVELIPTFIVMPDSAFNQLSQGQHIAECEHILLVVFKWVFVGLRVLEMKVTRVSILTEQPDVDVSVGTSPLLVARLHVNLVRCC